MAKYKYFKRTASTIDGDITLSAELFRLLALIDETREIGVIARESGMDTAAFKQHMKKLYEMGLIIPVVKKIIHRYSADFLAELTALLTYHLGPVADIIMADILSDLGIRDRKIPKDELEQLVSRIMDEIPGY